MPIDLNKEFEDDKGVKKLRKELEDDGTQKLRKELEDDGTQKLREELEHDGTQTLREELEDGGLKTLHAQLNAEGAALQNTLRESEPDIDAPMVLPTPEHDEDAKR